jgi:hypothetical protein
MRCPRCNAEFEGAVDPDRRENVCPQCGEVVRVAGAAPEAYPEVMAARPAGPDAGEPPPRVMPAAPGPKHRWGSMREEVVRAPQRSSSLKWLLLGGGGCLFLLVCCGGLTALAIIFGPLLGRGQKLDVADADFYYKDPVTKEEAQAVYQFVKEDRAGIADRFGCQVTRSGSTYEVRFPVKKGMENDDATQRSMKLLGRRLASRAFKGQPVDVHLCDENLNTLRVIPAGPALGTYLPLNKGEFYYTAAITKDEGERLQKFLEKAGGFGDLKSVVQADRAAKTVQLRATTKPGVENDQFIVLAAKATCLQVSKEVFAGQAVEFHCCDEFLETKKVVLP